MLRYSKCEDIELLHALRDGDGDAFSEIYNRYWEILFVSAYQRLNDEEISKDIVQDIFVKLWASRKASEIRHLKAYLQSAVRYQVYNHISRDKTADYYFRFADTLRDEFPAAPDSELIYSELAGRYDDLLRQMPSRRKEIFSLRFEQELSTREISDRLKISQKTVQNQLIKAIAYLKTGLASVGSLVLFLF